MTASPDFRPAAVAGAFYAGDARELQRDVDHLLAQAAHTELDAAHLRALIVPHAGYIYSGPVAASAYRLLADRPRKISRVILLGPSHQVPLLGIAAPTVQAFATPLGEIPLDRDSLETLGHRHLIQFRDDAHALEHSLEVQLPFLQTVLGDFSLIPLVVGHSAADQVAGVLEQLWDLPDSLIVISTDLSHFLDYESACALDFATSRRIEKLDDTLHGEEACGCHPLNGLLHLARQRHLKVRELDLRNSGDTAGSRDRVVGYGSYVVYD